MKKYISILCSTLLFFSSCADVDNYDAPNCAMEGQIIDAETNEPVEFTITQKYVRCYEINDKYPNPLEFDIPVKLGGEFKNTRMFQGDYKVMLYNAPAIPQDTAYVTLKPGKTTNVTLTCIPFLRFSELEVKNDTLYFRISKPKEIPFNGNIGIGLCRGDSPNLSYANCTQDDATLIGVPTIGGASQDSVFSKRHAFALNNFVNSNGTVRIEPGEYFFKLYAQIEKSTPYTQIYSPSFKGTYVGNNKK